MPGTWDGLDLQKSPTRAVCRDDLHRVSLGVHWQFGVRTMEPNTFISWPLCQHDMNHQRIQLRIHDAECWHATCRTLVSGQAQQIFFLGAEASMPPLDMAGGAIAALARSAVSPDLLQWCSKQRV